MRTRAPALVVVVAFALAVAALAVFAAKSDDHRLVKLPVASLGGFAADEAGISAASARSSPVFAGSMEYRVEGTLPALPGSAPAYRLGSTSAAPAVQRLAESLGLVGDVQEDDHGWVVRAGDRELRVQRFPGLPWYLGESCPEAPVSSEEGQTVVSCSASSAGVTPVRRGSSSAGGTGTAGGCAPDGGCVVADPAPGSAPLCPPEDAECAKRAGTSAAVCADAAGSAECAVPVPLPEPVCEPGAECPAPPAPACSGGTVECLPPPVPSCPPGVACAQPESAPAVVPPGAESLPVDTKSIEPAVEPLPVEKPPRPAGLPSEEEARKLAREGFARLGVGTEGLVVEDGWLTWEARVEARVDGLPVMGLGTSLSIGEGGEIVRANGFLAVPDRIGDYPLVGVDAGLRRLTTGFGFGAEPEPMPYATDVGNELKGASEPVPPECGDPTVSCVPPPQPAPMIQVVTGVHLALLQVGDALVPAYAFELAEEGGPIPVPAVIDEWLDQQGSTPKG